MTPETAYLITPGQTLAVFVAGGVLGFVLAVFMLVKFPDNSAFQIERLERDRIALSMVVEYWKAEAERRVRPIIIGGERDRADVQD